jgi:predicted nucleotidyltransferase
MGGVTRLDGLPGNVAATLSTFLAAARDALAADLVSAVLFGSAAEGKLGPTSDVNLLLVLRKFAPDKILQLRDAFLAAEAAIKLRVMFVQADEVSSAAEFFAQKFADILRRHRIVFGQDVLVALKVSRRAEIFRLRQILLNLVLRLRESYIARGHRPEQVALILADTFGPLRAACATLLELEGALNTDSTAALTNVAASFGPQGVNAAARLLEAHDRAPPMAADAQDVLFQVLELAMHVFERTARLT